MKASYTYLFSELSIFENYAQNSCVPLYRCLLDILTFRCSIFKLLKAKNLRFFIVVRNINRFITLDKAFRILSATSVNSMRKKERNSMHSKT